MTRILDLKRGMDLLVSAVAIILTAPLWIPVAIAVRLTSRGPVLYAGRRVGRYGTEFAMYKFRTMRVGSDRQGPAITGAEDDRITPLGRLLRNGKLDELPQLINVLRGEMSLVGPRPEAPQYVECYSERQRRVLSVRPGITGPTQLHYRHEEKLLNGPDIEQQYRTDILPRKLEMDLLYVDSRTLAGDIRLVAATVARLFDRHAELVEAT